MISRFIYCVLILLAHSLPFKEFHIFQYFENGKFLIIERKIPKAVPKINDAKTAKTI